MPLPHLQRPSAVLDALDASALPLVPMLGEIEAALARRGLAVLVAEPGSGKSTLVPLRLAAGSVLPAGKILVLEPRRVAAASVATRAAEYSGGPCGGAVGYRVRLESRTSRATVVEYLTEGMLTRRLQADPALAGVSVVVFDEFHERSAAADLALALALDARALGASFAILVMSATMDAQAVAAFLADSAGPVPVLDCPGAVFPVDTRYRPVPGRGRVGPELVAALPAILSETQGDVLAFLPGAGEIADATSAAGRELARFGVEVRPLHGSLPLALQREVLVPRAAGAPRRVILATNVAETSLTVPGVRVVVDAGLVRLLRYQERSGMDRLSLEAASQRSCDQRRGRAGRTAPGSCYRLWSPDNPRPRDTEPELLRTELSEVLLDCALWGVRDLGSLRFLDPPRRESWAAAAELLRELGALDAEGGPTERGAALARLGVHPRLGVVVLQGARSGRGDLACAAAAFLSDRDASGLRDEADLSLRLELLRRGSQGANRYGAAAGDGPGRADGARSGSQDGGAWGPSAWEEDIRRGFRAGRDSSVEAWRRRTFSLAQDLRSRLLGLDHGEKSRGTSGAALRGPGAEEGWASGGSTAPAGAHAATGQRGLSWSADDEAELGPLVAPGYPDRVAKLQDSGRFRFPSGREARLDGALAREEWIVAPEVDAGERLGRVRLASPLAAADAEAALGSRLVVERVLEWSGLVPRAVELRVAGRLALSRRRVAAEAGEVGESLARRVAAEGLSILPWDDSGGEPLRRLQRIRFYLAAQGGGSGGPGAADLGAAEFGAFSDAALVAEAASWLGPFLSVSGPALDGPSLSAALDYRLGAAAGRLDSLVPERLETPAGTKRRVDYASGEPVLEGRIQEFFGMADTPRILGAPAVLRLLSPAERPIQITRDLASFWSTTYAEVRKELRGRYPRHYWPEDPLQAEPTSRPKRRGT